MRDNALLSLSVWQRGKRAMISTVVSPWGTCWKQEISITIAGVLSIGNSGRKGKRRQEGLEVVEREGAPACSEEKSSSFKLSCKAEVQGYADYKD